MWGKIIFFIDVYIVFLKEYKLYKIGGLDQITANNSFQISLQTLALIQN